MASIILRNRVTTEYKQVEADSDEYWSLRAEVHADGRPRWEQTGEHDYEAFKQRVATGTLRAEDVGDADQPVGVSTGFVSPTQVGLDRSSPTPGEIEQKAGRAAKDAAPVSVGEAVGEGYPAGHPPQTDADVEDSVTTTPSQEKIAAKVGASTPSKAKT